MEYVELIAKVCHEANRAFCEALGDMSQRSWEEAEQWQRDSAIAGVKFRLDNPKSEASDLHENWVKDKAEAGWVYGPVKDAGKKEHPCMVPYNELPMEQKQKDHLFRAIVDVLK